MKAEIAIVLSIVLSACASTSDDQASVAGDEIERVSVINLDLVGSPNAPGDTYTFNFDPESGINLQDVKTGAPDYDASATNGIRLDSGSVGLFSVDSDRTPDPSEAR